MFDHSPHGAHPLATQLATRYADDGMTRPVIEIAAGSGRNTRHFVDLHIPIVSLRDDEPYTQLPGGRDLYAAALSTHGYLHGTVDKLRLGFAELRRVLQPKAPAYFTLGSMRDARFGLGVAVDEVTFAPGDGDEAGIPHAYFDRDGALDVLKGTFSIDSLEEHNVDAIAGRWAHAMPRDMWHWFVIARCA